MAEFLSEEWRWSLSVVLVVGSGVLHEEFSNVVPFASSIAIRGVLWSAFHVWFLIESNVTY